MGEEKNTAKAVSLDSEELGQVTGGSAWRDDPEAMENIRKEGNNAGGGIVTDAAEKASPVSGAGVLDRLALGVDRIKEELTQIATRK